MAANSLPYRIRGTLDAVFKGLTSYEHFWALSLALLAFDAVLTAAIVLRVPCEEIALDP